MNIENSEPIPKEYELVYGAKERKEDILADTMGLPFQKVKQFGTTKKNEWENKLILGDNLQVTKHLLKLKKEGKLRNEDGSDGFKLICIDPPFATKQEFRGSSGEQAYSDKIIGSEYIEYIRKRLMILYELLTEDGSIFVHMDYRNSSNIKVIMDEVFGVTNYRNSIIWVKSTNPKGSQHTSPKFSSFTDTILYYSKSKSTPLFLDRIRRPLSKEELEKKYDRKDEKGRFSDGPIESSASMGARPTLVYEYKGYTPGPSGWRVKKSILEQIDQDGNLGWTSNGKPYRKLRPEDDKGEVIGDFWNDISLLNSQSLERIGYPTQKPEKLIDRIIQVSSNNGDLVLDSFCGSGTALAVAEKLDRRWVGIDSSKFSIYTCQKRLLNLKKEIGNTGKPLKPKPFGIYNAGLYVDGPHLKELDDEEYSNFALELFQAQPTDSVLNGFEMDGIMMNSPVHIFPRDGSLTEEYIEHLDKVVGSFIKDRMFIIVPANRVYFLQDYIEIKGKRYYALRIPYSIIDELHKKKFVRPWQPASETDMNQVIDSVGFDFVHPPEVEADYSKNSKDEFEIKIKRFESTQRTKNPIDFNDKESLSMVLIDNDYNGDHFNMTDFFFANQIKDNKWKITFKSKNVSKKIMIIYLDVLGNERREVKNLKDFRGKKN